MVDEIPRAVDRADREGERANRREDAQRAEDGNDFQQDQQEFRAVAGESNLRLASMTVRGMAVVDVKLSDFIQQLEQFGVFASVELRTAHETKIEGKSVQEFELECSHYE